MLTALKLMLILFYSFSTFSVKAHGGVGNNVAKSSLYQTSDNTFSQDVLQSSIPVLVDFSADWCGPCQRITPILVEVSKEIKGKIKVVKINVDHNRYTPKQFDVSSIPTLILFKDGRAVSIKVGVLQKGEIIEWLQDLI